MYMLQVFGYLKWWRALKEKWCVKRTETCWIYFFLVVDMLLHCRISIASALQQLLRWREVDDSNANWWGLSKAWLSMTIPYLGSGRFWNNWRRPQLLENHLEGLAHFQVARQTCFLCYAYSLCPYTRQWILWMACNVQAPNRTNHICTRRWNVQKECKASRP